MIVRRVSDNSIKRMGDGLETLSCLKARPCDWLGLFRWALLSAVAHSVLPPRQVLCMANNHVHTIANIDELPIRVLDLVRSSAALKALLRQKPWGWV